MRQDSPVRQQHDGGDELQQMPPAPEQELARKHQLTALREQRPRDRKGDQGETIDEAGDRHCKRERRQRRPPARQIEKKARHRGEHAERQQKEPHVISRMADEREIVGELRLGRIEKCGRKQAWESDQHEALPDPAKRRGPQVFAADAKRRDRNEEREHAEKPNHQRKHDVDDKTLVEEPDRPERRAVHSRNSGEREQKGKHAGDRERADRKPGPVAKLAANSVRNASGVESGDRRGRRSRRLAHCLVSSRSADRDGPPSHRRRDPKRRRRARVGTSRARSACGSQIGPSSRCRRSRAP